MSQSKHTPGPWRPSKGGPNGCPVVGTQRGLMICMLSHSVSDPTHAEQAKANANLIAAAPDMLAALKELTDYSRKPLQDHWQAADDAIAKAEGRL